MARIDISSENWQRAQYLILLEILAKQYAFEELFLEIHSAKTGQDKVELQDRLQKRKEQIMESMSDQLFERYGKVDLSELDKESDTIG